MPTQAKPISAQQRKRVADFFEDRLIPLLGLAQAFRKGQVSAEQLQQKTGETLAGASLVITQAVAGGAA